MNRRSGKLVPSRSVVWFGIVAAAALVFIGIAATVVTGRVDPIDDAVMRVMQHIDAPLLDRVMITATHIGDGVTRAIVAALVVGWALYRRRPRCAILLIANALAAPGLNALLKALFARDRPVQFNEIALPDSFSFPSGHAMSAMVFYGTLAAITIAAYPRARRWVIAVSAVLITAIGFSRTYLGVHWLSDVIAGFAAGVPLLAAAIRLLRRGPATGQCSGRGSASPAEARADSARPGTPFDS